MQITHSSLTWVVLAGALIVLAACGETATGPQAESSVPSFRRQQGTERGRHLLLARGSLSADFKERVEALGGTIERRHDEIGVVTLSGLTEDAAQNLIARSDVDALFPDVSLQMAPDVLSTRLTGAGESDPTQAEFYDLQWHLPTIDADDAWESSNRGAGALVCILDSGADTDHPDLAGRVDLDKSASFVTGEDLEDFLNHGTFVAAVVSSNGIKVASVAPEATLCIVKVMDVLGYVDFSNLIAGILHAANVGADIINMSLGGYVSSKSSESGAIHALQLAINYANSKGTLLVAAAGNDGLDLDRDPNYMRHVPSQLPHVMSVGATTRENELRISSNYGRTGLDIVAPGEDVVSACDFMHSSSGACIGSGTSFSVPQAAGAAAVVFSELRHNAEGSQLGHCVTVGATRLANNGRDSYFGKGLVNVLGAAACRTPN